MCHTTHGASLNASSRKTYIVAGKWMTEKSPVKKFLKMFLIMKFTFKKQVIKQFMSGVINLHILIKTFNVYVNVYI